MAEERFETRRTFLPGIGHVVEQVPLGTPVVHGQRTVAAAPLEPAKRVTIAAVDVPLELALQVVAAAGLVTVPPNFLNPEQLADLGMAPPQGVPVEQTAPEKPASPGKTAAQVKAHKLPVEQMIAQVQQADDFETLNDLMADETRKTVIAAAEERAAELKGQGAK